MTTNNEQHIFSIPQLHKNEERVKKYLNRMQREFAMLRPHTAYIVASRGTGKSEGIDAVRLRDCIWSMPGSTGALVSPSYAKAWGNTLPAMCKALAEWGIIQDIHYFVGRRAPNSAGFKQPRRKPLQTAWKNCLHFWNGTILVVLSFAQGMSANSMSLDWIIGPEAKFLDWEKIKSEINPANRGNRKDFGDCPLHHSVLYSTDMPTSKKGRWILDKREDMQPKHIQLLFQLYKEKTRLATLKNPTTQDIQLLKEISAEFDIARRYQPAKNKDGSFIKKKREYTVFYGEYDVFDNLEVLGADFIHEMHRDSPPLIWRTAFLNERLFKVQNGFYSALNDDLHFYIPNGVIDAEVSELVKTKSDTCLLDSDLDLYAPLHVAFDANSAICTIAIAQVYKDKNVMKTVKSDFVKTPDKLQDLVIKVCNYYRDMPIKEVVFYFDHTFTWTTGTSHDSYADTITNAFTQHGWHVTQVYIGQQPRHEVRHNAIDQALKGNKEWLFPQFNLLNNEYLKLAMEQTGVRQGKDGFEKDKSAEKLADSTENPDEYKTHITDAWDTVFIGVNRHYKEPSKTTGGIIFLS